MLVIDHMACLQCRNGHIRDFLTKSYCATLAFLKNEKEINHSRGIQAYTRFHLVFLPQENIFLKSTLLFRDTTATILKVLWDRTLHFDVMCDYTLAGRG